MPGSLPGPRCPCLCLRAPACCFFLPLPHDAPPLQIVSVDQSVQPPSYGIDLPSGYRETEASRLQPLPAPPPGEQAPPEGEAVQGLGHRDAATEAKEAAVRALEE